MSDVGGATSSLAACRELVARLAAALEQGLPEAAALDQALADVHALGAELARARGGASAGVTAPEVEAARPVILIVEDQEDNRVIYRRTLRKHYELVEVEDGESAVEQVRALLPRLVLMDISLPLMDGLEATRLLKGDAATAKVPIVLVTAHAMKGNREEALASGADDYLTKPFSPSGLRELVQRFIPAGD
ncbi:MAG: response regulator [Myxococcales bacterium]|nr:response regulator [Myxococcales bacterium]MCB9735806.1 response regulator [Deltaproteobacteria bacterium]